MTGRPEMNWRVEDFESGPEAMRALVERGIAPGLTDGRVELEALLERWPDCAEALGALYYILALHGDFSGAIHLLQRLSQLQPKNPEPLWRQGDFYVNLAEPEKARQAYEKALEVQPDCEDAALGLKVLGRMERSAPDLLRQPWSPPEKSWPARQQENAKKNEAEFKAQKTRLESLPSRLYLETTTRCNFYCRTCVKGYQPYYAEDLQPEIRRAVEEELFPGAHRISITGFGEPLLADCFDGLLERALAEGLEAHFVTNGSLMTLHRIHRLSGQRVQISLSLDGARKETFESIRRGGHFDKILEKLELLKKARQIHLGDQVSQLELIVVLLRSNLEELPEIVELGRRFEVSRITFVDYSLGQGDFDTESPRHEPEKANRFLKKASEKAREFHIPLQRPPYYEEGPNRSVLHFTAQPPSGGGLLPAPKRFPRHCLSPWKEPYIRTDGVVTPCCGSDQFLGRLGSGGFGKLWNGWRYRFFRLRMKSPFPPVHCRNCHLIWGINAGNPVNVIRREGKILKALYKLELFLHHKWDRVLRCWPGGKDASQKPPNYCQGKPWKPE